jgi:hypothetical protein
MTSTTRLRTEFKAQLDAEQFTQVIEAILAGKYSWACVLMLRFSGHNPLHYIPYRTYNRLVKEDLQQRVPRTHIEDLPHLEPVAEPKQVQGGQCDRRLLPSWQLSRSGVRYM